MNNKFKEGYIMNNKFKLTSAILTASLLVTPISGIIHQNNNVAKAEYNKINEKNSFEIEIDLTKIDVEYELSKAKILLNSNLISQEEYNTILMILKPELFFNPYSRSYYPEQKIGYINNWGVKHMYEKGLRYAKFAEAVSAIALGAIPGVGWGLSAISLAATFGGYNYLEQIVQQAYWQGKGIDVYYQIHKGVTSLNKIRLVVI